MQYWGMTLISLVCMQRLPHAVVLGLLELNCDWLKIPTSQKSTAGKRYVCVRRVPRYRQTNRMTKRAKSKNRMQIIEAPREQDNMSVF